MDVAFGRLSCLFWGGKDHEATNLVLNPSFDFASGIREPDSIKVHSVNNPRFRSSPKTFKKWHSREDRRARIDREHDAVIVPSDGECLSGSESDGSDWSIGWMEPHASDFLGDAEDAESSFAVLVQCYGHGLCAKPGSMKAHSLNTITGRDEFSSEGMEYIERWLLSLQDI